MNILQKYRPLFFAWRRPSFYTFSPDYDGHYNKLFIIAILLFLL